MKLLENLISPLANCEETAYSICQALYVSVTKTSLVKALSEHPDYPSMLAISDVMCGFGIDNVSLCVKDIDFLTEYPAPFIDQIKPEKSNNSLFVVIYS